VAKRPYFIQTQRLISTAYFYRSVSMYLCAGRRLLHIFNLQDTSKLLYLWFLYIKGLLAITLSWYLRKLYHDIIIFLTNSEVEEAVLHWSGKPFVHAQFSTFNHILICSFDLLIIIGLAAVWSARIVPLPLKSLLSFLNLKLNILVSWQFIIICYQYHPTIPVAIPLCIQLMDCLLLSNLDVKDKGPLNTHRIDKHSPQDGSHQFH